MVVTMAVLRLFGLGAGALALAALALSYTEAGAPRWVWAAVLAAEALARAVPPGRLATRRPRASGSRRSPRSS